MDSCTHLRQREILKIIASFLDPPTFFSFRCVSHTTSKFTLPSKFRTDLFTMLEQHRWKEAKLFLSEGITLNPDSPELVKYSCVSTATEDVELNYLLITKHAHAYTSEELLLTCFEASYLTRHIHAEVPLQVPAQDGLINNPALLEYLISLGCLSRLTTADVDDFVHTYFSDELALGLEIYWTNDPIQDLALIAGCFARYDQLTVLAKYIFKNLSHERFPFNQLIDMSVNRKDESLSLITINLFRGRVEN